MCVLVCMSVYIASQVHLKLSDWESTEASLFILSRSWKAAQELLLVSILKEHLLVSILKEHMLVSILALLWW